MTFCDLNPSTMQADIGTKSKPCGLNCSKLAKAYKVLAKKAKMEKIESAGEQVEFQEDLWHFHAKSQSMLGYPHTLHWKPWLQNTKYFFGAELAGSLTESTYLWRQKIVKQWD